MRVSEALDLGSIPNMATKNPVSSLEMGFLFFECVWWSCAVGWLRLPEPANALFMVARPRIGPGNCSKITDNEGVGKYINLMLRFGRIAQP